jgi:hypothetical protein
MASLRILFDNGTPKGVATRRRSREEPPAQRNGRVKCRTSAEPESNGEPDFRE